MNFALILLVLCAITGALWAADKFYFRKRRSPEEADPVWVEWGASFFPVIVAVFFLRSFLVEPFKIPSGSMKPTLLVGDFILVNKYTYGIRLPVINKKVMDVGLPETGDVIVFRYPPNPSLDYIKRVVGLPGDQVVYRNKRLSINGREIPVQQGEDFLETGLSYLPRYAEQLGKIGHEILIDPQNSNGIGPKMRFPYFENCQYNNGGVSCIVPAGHYFVMGDNRDNSEDSRYWGFVPEENIVGKAFFIWFNASSDVFKRIGSFH